LTREDGKKASYRRFAVTGEPGGLQQIDVAPSGPLFMTPFSHLEVFPPTIIVRHDPPHPAGRWQGGLFGKGRVYYQYLLESNA
jgi:hypothetical protein